MTLHPLTKELLSARFEYSPHRDESIDRVVRTWATNQALWLKKEFHGTVLDHPGFNDRIDRAFQIAPETLEEKFRAIQRKHDGNYAILGDFWDAVLKECVQAAEEHFSNNPPKPIDKTL